jgi:hypothetical protein
MKTLLLFFFLLSFTTIYAQVVDAVKKYNPDIVALLLHNKATDNMPNALRNYKSLQYKLGNNGKGFDIYEDQLDKMPILKPDSTNYNKMPNAVPGKILLPPFKIEKLQRQPLFPLNNVKIDTIH